ncbi:MAG: hypothetical protein MRZ79_25060 [Bacteroidia bacterium]|nr:hypothetical protein [Bacteroidia bacterium]
MKSFRNYFNLLGFAVVLLALVTSCKEDIYGGEENLQFKLVDNNDFGKILVNQNNQSIYFFADDVTGSSNCTDGCLDAWPKVTGDVYELASGLYDEDFGTIDAGYGEKQITYKGWPLYYYSPSGDGELEAAWETKGDGVGSVWHIAKPDYNVLLGRQEVEPGKKMMYLTNDRGVSFYTNSADGENASTCTGGCADVWPPFKKVELVLPSSLYENDFAEAYRDDNLGPQFSYKGAPVYYFSQDEGKMGSVKGQNGGPNKTFYVAEKK